ncbi:cytochrome-b5 reductase [Crepidotus variabilis]|uniref:NADH-cytochrome b5 reductase n=1 Tax=Crepidotus variabilis TaxID=179855 RepID=A0A9P6EUG2_9AGAR|nr:cytochrome-b5 reductase [Crepidotus variabilis]
MSFTSFARRSLLAGARTRCYSTAQPAAPKANSNLPAILIGVGAASLAGYWYLDSRAAPVKTKQEKSPLDPQNFKDFKLKKVEPYNHNTARFVFELPNNEASLIPITSCLVVKSSDPEALKTKDGKPVIRPYTPVSESDHAGELVLLIKKYDTGVMSKHIHDLKPGDSLSMKGPIAKFPYKANEFDQVALIGGGSGITPLYQLLTHALPDKSNKTKFKLIYANISEDDILLRKELDDLKAKYPATFDVLYVVDKAPAGWAGGVGYVNKDLIKANVGPAELKEKVKIFICGPPGQVNAVAGKKDGMKQGAVGGVLKELGYTEDQVFKF